jgi:O-acetyl-ADP-ribose deacetylase (regulator of RNase III)
MEVTVQNSSLTRVMCDAIVCPANSFGMMGGGVAKHLKELGGDDIEEDAIAQAPTEIGTAISTEAGQLRCEYIIHSPTMRDPGTQTDENSVRDAVRAALQKADELECESIAIPGMGTGIGGIGKDVAARAMVEVIEAYPAKHVAEVYLLDIDEDMVAAWEQNLK